MAKKKGKMKAQAESLENAIKLASQERYLGDYRVVGGLLRAFANKILTTTYTDAKVMEADLHSGARALAKVFLGEDPNYPGPSWFSSGQIDLYVAKWAGVDSDQPEERLMGGLMSMIAELLDFSAQVQQQGLLQEQWQPAADEIMEKYTKMFLGIPRFNPYRETEAPEWVRGFPGDRPKG